MKMIPWLKNINMNACLFRFDKRCTHMYDVYISQVCILKINNLSFSYFGILDNYLKKDATTHHQRYKGMNFV